MKAGDLVDTINGPGRIAAISWRRTWIAGRSRKDAVMIVQHGHRKRAYYSDQVWPYDSRMSESTETPEPEPQPDDDNGDEDE